MARSDKPIVKDGLLWPDGDTAAGPSGGVRVGSPRWYAWLLERRGFVFRGGAGHFTARCELRRGRPYWYAYRSRGGAFLKTYLGKSAELTHERLTEACTRLAGQATPSHVSAQPDSAHWMSALDGVPAGAPGTWEPAGVDLSFMPLTKIHPPALPAKLVTRPRLTQRITAPITLITAPSGFGKTTLLNEWRQNCGMPVVWVSLDATDNHPWRFWSTVIAALQTVHPAFGQDLLPHLRPLSYADLAENVLSLTNAIMQVTAAPNMVRRFGLVLDDYHHIEDQEIHASLQLWLEHLPPALQLVISSHIRPPLALGHLRASGMVAELVTEDLRFTLDEGIGFLSQRAGGRALTYNDMQSLVKHTEGWVTGLTLATLALPAAGDHSKFLVAFSGAHPYLREYFIESVLSRQPAEVQAFLLDTAILKHLTGPLCDAVTGRTDGAEMLARLWQANLFLVRLEEPHWYRYHDLFAEALRSQLQLQFPGSLPRLHRQAAQWYRSQNAPDDAVYHLLAVEAWEEAASLIEDIVLRELEQSGDYSRLLRWLRQLPETVVQRHRTLLRVYVRVAALDLSRMEVKQILARVETNILRRPDGERTAEERSVLAEIRRIRRLWMAGDTEPAPLPGGGSHDDVWQMLDAIVTYARYIRRDSDRAETVARELYASAVARSHLYVMLVAAGGLAYYLLRRGELRAGERVAREALQRAITQRGKLPESASVPLVMLSRAYYDRNQLAQAHQLLLRAAEVDPNPTSSNVPIMAAVQRARIEFAQGDAAAAQATVQAARELQARRPAGLYRDTDLLAYQAWFCVRQGDGAGAERLLSEAGGDQAHAFLALVRASLLLEQGQPAQAADLLRRLIEQYPRGLYLEPALGARILLAVALFEQHEVNPARQVMAGAVRAACAEGLLRPFLDHRRPSATLLALVRETSGLTAVARAFVEQILCLLGAGAQGAPPGTGWAALTRAASITEREGQILRLVSAGLSNREIAAQFSLAESTVKTHLKNIYRKLDVNNRTRAVAQARALKLA